MPSADRLRQGKSWHLFVGIFLIVAGVSFVFGGEWLHWDFWSWGWYHPYQMDPNWRFCSPGYWWCVDAANASKIFDYAMGLVLVGALILLVLGVYITVTVYENMQDLAEDKARVLADT